MRTVEPSDSAVHPGRYQLPILKVKVNRAVTVRERSEMDPDVTSKGPRSGNCLIDPSGYAQWPLGGHAGGQGLPR